MSDLVAITIIRNSGIGVYQARQRELEHTSNRFFELSQVLMLLYVWLFGLNELGLKTEKLTPRRLYPKYIRAFN